MEKKDVTSINNDDKKQRPGYCLNKDTPQCSVPNKLRDCEACQAIHLKEAISSKPTSLDLETYADLGPREKVNYIYNNALRKRYAAYKPVAGNPLSSRKRNLARIRKFHGLSMAHIFHIFHSLQKEAENNTRLKLQSQGLTDNEIDVYIQQIRDGFYKHDSEFVKNDDGSYVLDESNNKIRNERKDIVEESILYNYDPNEHTFTHSVGKLKNTVFDEYSNNRICANAKKKFATLLSFPYLTYVQSGYQTLSDQIADIIDGKIPWPASLPRNQANESLLNDYFEKIYEIEGFIDSDKRMGDGVINESFTEILGYMKQSDVIAEEDVVTTNTKEKIRTTEKVVNKSGLDIRTITDMTRGTIKCRSVKDMISKIWELFGSVDTYNKKLGEHSSRPHVEELGLISKIGPIDDLPPLSSGYGDAKYHIKFNNGSVVELQFQVDRFYEGKTEGFDTLNEFTNAEVIKKLKFTEKEKKSIYNQIERQNIDLEGEDFFDLPSDFLLPGDTVYRIYRSLPGFKAKGASNTTVNKLQLLEREIHMEGRLRNMKDIMTAEQHRIHENNDNALRSRLGQ